MILVKQMIQVNYMLRHQPTKEKVPFYLHQSKYDLLGSRSLFDHDKTAM